MNRTSQVFNLRNSQVFKDHVLQWSTQFKEVAWLDSNRYPHLYSEFDAILAVDAATTIKTTRSDVFKKLKKYLNDTKDWIFGYLSYDIKNDTEALYSNNADALDFPDMYFFQPRKIIFMKGNCITFSYLSSINNEIEEDLTAILAIDPLCSTNRKIPHQFIIKSRLQKKQYITRTKEMLKRIQAGDIYEANLCQEFYVTGAILDTLTTYKELNSISKTPFSAYLKLHDYHVLSASPERYLKKKGSQLIAQPIKGTAKRAIDYRSDTLLKINLKKDRKERAENIMIVDLVRNDLAKVAKKGSVHVEELCQVYTFKQLHQMISTITCTSSTHNPIPILEATFPMGSMTGAPKISAMKIIEQLEVSKRGVYSGAVGYFSPKGDFDFNVVIRSILYNASKKYISFSVGSAITAKSSPTKEYNECMAKAAAMKQVLAGNR